MVVTTELKPRLLAWPMSRFYNEGDHHAAEVDWSDADLRIYEKLDGTMIVLYYNPDKGQWHVGTRGVPEADVELNGGVHTTEKITFAQLFWRALEATIKRASGSKKFDVEEWKTYLDKDVTYVLELTSPVNRVVVRYDEETTTLLAARRLSDGRELDPLLVAPTLGLPTPRVWKLDTVAAVKAFVESCDPASMEGAVACDSKFRRVKVKSKAWVLASRSKDAVMTSRRGALEAILDGSVDDVIPLVAPDLGQVLEELREKTRALFVGMDERFRRYRDEADGSRKTFAGFVMANGEWHPPFFAMFEGKAKSVGDYVEGLRTTGKLTDSILDTILRKVG